MITTTLAVLLGLALGWILADVADIGRRWEDWRERKRIEKRFREEYNGRTYVISGRMDPDFVPPSTSMNPNATHAPSRTEPTRERTDTMKANLTLTPHGYGSAIEIDGIDVAKAVRGLTLRAGVGEITELELDVRVIHGTTLSGEVVVTIPDETRGLLEQLGWTPPPSRSPSTESEKP